MSTLVGALGFWAKIQLMEHLTWLTAVIMPFFVFLVAISMLQWLLLDKLSMFFVTGNWNGASYFDVSPTSPMIIMLYVGLVLGFVFLLTFFLNYVMRNVRNINGVQVLRRLLLFLTIFIFTIIVPFALMFMCVFVSLITQLIRVVMVGNLQFLQSPKYLEILQNNLTNLDAILGGTNVNIAELPDKVEWENIWQNIDNPVLLNYKEEIWNTLTKINALLNYSNGGSNKVIFDYLDSINVRLGNINELKSFLNSNGLGLIGPEKIAELVNEIGRLNELVNGLYANGMEIENINKIKELINFDTFVMSRAPLSNIMRNTIEVGGMVFDENGNLLQSSNIGFTILEICTGIKINSILSLSHYSFWIVAAFNVSNYFVIPLFNLVPCVLLTGVAVGASAKGIGKMIMMLIGRWVMLFMAMPYGFISFARKANDDGETFAVWQKEILTSFTVMIVVFLNFKICIMIYSMFCAGLYSENGIHLEEIITYDNNMNNSIRGEILSGEENKMFNTPILIKRLVMLIMWVLLLTVINMTSEKILAHYQSSSFSTADGFRNLNDGARANKQKGKEYNDKVVGGYEKMHKRFGREGRRKADETALKNKSWAEASKLRKLEKIYDKKNIDPLTRTSYNNKLTTLQSLNETAKAKGFKLNFDTKEFTDKFDLLNKKNNGIVD